MPADIYGSGLRTCRHARDRAPPRTRALSSRPLSISLIFLSLSLSPPLDLPFAGRPARNIPRAWIERGWRDSTARSRGIIGRFSASRRSALAASAARLSSVSASARSATARHGDRENVHLAVHVHSRPSLACRSRRAPLTSVIGSFRHLLHCN